MHVHNLLSFWFEETKNEWRKPILRKTKGANIVEKEFKLCRTRKTEPKTINHYCIARRDVKTKEFANAFFPIGVDEPGQFQEIKNHSKVSRGADTRLEWQKKKSASIRLKNAWDSGKNQRIFCFVSAESINFFSFFRQIYFLMQIISPNNYFFF